jgi:succinate dehydrogenase / fumarate reductase, iron-sulfur subunit
MKIRLRILRGRGAEKSRWQDFSVEVDLAHYVLDALEAAGGEDATLSFRHACHHASCGSCAVRINGREQLPCIVRVRDAVSRGGVIRLEPLRHFPRVFDLVVERTHLLESMRSAGMPLLRDADPREAAEGYGPPQRMEDCIECGICISACPIAGSDSEYIGPAALAAAERTNLEPAAVRSWVDTRHGVWRCHGVFACSDACPLQVDPASAILRLRSRVPHMGGRRRSEG